MVILKKIKLWTIIMRKLEKLEIVLGKSNAAIEIFAFKIIHWIGSVVSLLTHTLFFTLSLLLYFSNIFDKQTVLLVITLIVSLEAIYLSIFIQMSVNSQAKKLQSIQEDVEDIQEDVEDIQENVEDIQEDVEDIQENVEEINNDEEDDEDDSDLEEIKETLKKLMVEVIELKKKNRNK